MIRSMIEIMDDMDRHEKIEISDELIEILKDHFKEEIETEKLGLDLKSKQVSDVEAFKRESDKARNIPLSQEDIKRINDLAREVDNQ